MPETTPGTSRNGGILVISRGAKIIAAGTESCPIIFTSTLDVNVDGTYGITNKGKWGGLIVLGTATNNLTANNSGLGVAGLPEWEESKVLHLLSQEFISEPALQKLTQTFRLMMTMTTPEF
ncbi:MAG: hypothetical protein IPH46_17425 [Bacteroidetes bacterium]|nr:hypothetical protein [Bacteroidota bacterium]